MEKQQPIEGLSNVTLPAQSNTGFAARPRYLDPLPTGGGQMRSSLLIEYWYLVKPNRQTLLVLAILGFVAALLVTISQTPVYQARATLEIQAVNENFLNLGNVNPTDARSNPEVDVGTQVKVLQSDSVLHRVAAKVNGYGQTYPMKRSPFTEWRALLHLPQPKLHIAPDELSADRLQVRSEPNTRLIRILYDATDPQFAADVINILTSELIQKNLEDRAQTTQRTQKWLAQQMQDMRRNLENSEHELQFYADASGLLFTSEKDNTAEDTFKQIREQLEQTKADRIEKQSRYEMALASPAESLPEVVDDPMLKEYQLKLTDLRRQLAELSSTLTASHPSVIKIQAQAAALETALERKRTIIIGRIQNEFKSAQRRENLLEANYSSQARFMSRQAAKVAHYDILKREVDTNRQLYESMLRNFQQASMTSELNANNVRVVDSANPPPHPYKPNWLLNLTLGTLIGTVGGMVFAVVRERLNSNVQDPGETRIYLDVPELGVIPSRIETASQRFPYLHRQKSAALPERGSRTPVELSTADDGSILGEAYRATITSLLCCGLNDDPPRVVVVTSANPGEGKTTTASNLALAAAEIGGPVLLIDGDLRKGRLSEIFETSNDWGLNDVLQGKQVHGTAGSFPATLYKNLYLLPSGSPDLYKPSLLHSPRLKYLLDHIRRDFNMVIIDTPPMLYLTDARLFGRLADGVLLVVRSEQTPRATITAASQRLIEDHTRVLGTILNNWNPLSTQGYGFPSPYPYYGKPPASSS